MLDVWDLNQYYYCPRKFYYYKVLELSPIPRKKMTLGAEEHSSEKKRSKERKNYFGFNKEDVKEVLFDLYLESKKENLKGKLDCLLILKDNRLIPVEIKYSSYVRVYTNWRKQLIAYSLLLDDNYNTVTKKGVLYFSEQNKSIEVEIEHKDKEFLRKDISDLMKLYYSEEIPYVEKSSKCNYCELSKICV